MSLHGSDVYDTIGEKVSGVEREHEKLSSQIYDFENKITSLADERETCLTKLALIYLPELEAKAVASTIKEVQATVQKLFKEKQDRRAVLEQSMTQSTQQRKTLETQLAQVNSDLTKNNSEKQKLSTTTGELLKKNDTYVQLASQAKDLAGELDRNKKRAQELETAAKTKLPEYKQNKLFMYLLNRNFNPQDNSRGIFASLDRWVAGLINYEAQKREYDLLMSTSKLAAEVVAKKQEVYDGVATKGREIERQAADETGLTAILDKEGKMTRGKNNVTSEIAKVNEQYSKFAAERKELDSTKDEYHKEALAKLKDYLKGDDIEDLKRKARETPSSEDDKLVARMEEIAAQVKTYKNKAKQIKEQRDVVAEKLSGLKKLQSDFSNQDYDGSRSRFPEDFDVGSLLTGYLAGRMSSHDIWGHIESNQETEPAPSYHSSSDWGSSSSSSSSSWDSGGFSSGGGSGGGGFSSGNGV